MGRTKSRLLAASPAAVLLAGLTASPGSALPQSAERAEQDLRQVAVDAALWGVPIVSVDAMRQAFFRDAGAQYGDILYWSKPSDWKNQTTTPNASSHYVYFNFNTKEGPVVLEIPPTAGAGLFGSILDAWQRPQADVGPKGVDQGRGAKFALLPPGYPGEVPTGYVPVPLHTHNGYSVLRVIPEGSSESDVQRAIDLAKRLRIYAASQAADPPKQRFIDMSGKLFDGIVRFDASYFSSLARMVNEEPPLERDRARIDRLRALGIEKGKPFEPDDEARELLDSAAGEAHAWLVKRSSAEGSQYWPEAHWRSPNPVGVKTGFTFETDGELDWKSRATMYFLAYAPPKKIGKASFYLAAFVDRGGAALSGENTYRLQVPAGVPAKQFWATTVYDRETAGFLRGAPRVELNSYQTPNKNPDGSVDVYFGPEAPAGAEENWIYTAPGRDWFTIFRFYAPEKSLYEKTWKLPDIERTSVPRVR